MITSSFDTKSGRILLEIDTASTVSAQILSMGSLGYEFDQTPDSVSIERVQALYSQIQFDLMQYGDTAEDIWDILVAEATIADIACKVTLSTWEQDNYEFGMRLRLADISLDERSRRVTIRLIPNVNLGATVNDVFNALGSGKKKDFARYSINPSGITSNKTYTQKATGVLDWIESALNIIFDNNYTNDTKPSNTNLSPAYTAKVYDTVDSIVTGTKSLLMLNMGSDDFTSMDAGYETIQGVGLISSPGGGFALFGNIQTEITITGGTFTGQVQLRDRIVRSLGVGYGEVFNITSITATKLIVVTNFAPEITNEPWFIARPVGPNSAKAITILKDLAGIEGSVFGTGFSKNFYFNRLDRTTANTKTLNYDMVMDFKPKPFYLSLGTSIIAQRADGTRGNVEPSGGPEKYGSWSFQNLDTRVPNLRDFTSVATGNPNATKELRIELAPAYPFLNKGSWAVTFFDGDYSVYGTDAQTDTILESSLTANGIRSYFQALNNTEGGISVEFTLMGATSVFPWETVQFDTRAPEKYRNRQFRPTSIKYNFVNDTVTIKAYQIDDVETPVYTSPYVRTGLNQQYGKTLGGKVFEIATNDQIAGGLRKVATFTLSQPASGTTNRLFINRLNNDVTTLPANYKILLINPFNVQQQQELTIQVDVQAGVDIIQIEEALITPTFPAGSYVEVTTQSVLSSLIIAENSILAQVKASAIGVTTQQSIGLVTSIQANLNTRVRAGDDLFLINDTNGESRAFTVGATTGPGIVTLTLDQPTVFDAPAGSYITGSTAQYEAFLQVTPSGVLVKANAVSEQNGFALTSATVGAGTPTNGLPVTSVRTLTLKDAMQIGIQDKAGNTEFFQVDGDQNLTNATTTIDVVEKTPSVSVGAGASVFQPQWNQTAILSVQANEIATRVTEAQVEGIVQDYIGGLQPVENWQFEGTDEGFTTNNVTLTTDTTYIEYLATGSTPYIQKTVNYVATDNPVVTIRVQRVAGTNWGGAFGWTTDGSTYFTQTFVEPTGVDLDFQFATIDLTSNANYTGTITGVRLFLGEANLDEFYIDQFIIGKFNPQTEILADLSSRLTVAEAGLTNTANEFTTYTQNAVLTNASAVVAVGRNQTTTYDTVAITDTRGGFTVKDGQDFYLVNVDGTFQAVKIRDDQTVTDVTTPTTYTLKIQDISFSTTIEVGAMLYESAWTQSTRISQSAGEIVLKAEETDGEVTSIALIRLDASAPYPNQSKVTIQGDLVAINDIQITRGVGAAAGVIQTSNFVAGTSGWRIRGTGDAEFNDVTVRGSVFVTGGDAAKISDVDDVQDNVDIATYLRPLTFRQEDKPTSSNRPAAGALPFGGFIQGDRWIKPVGSDEENYTYIASLSDFIRDNTTIDGGFIKTGVVDTNRLNVSNIITVGSIATETFANTAASNAADSALSDAEDYADSVASSEATTARNAARNNIAQQLGYTNYDTMVSTVGASGTIIAAGFIRTSLIDVDDIFATNATITSTLTMGSGGLIRGGSGANQFSLENSGAYWGVFGGNLTVLTNTGISSSDDGDPTSPTFLINRVDGIIVQQAQSTADFTVSMTGAVRTKSSLRVDAEIQARGDLRVYDTDESHYANIAYADATANRTFTIPATGGNRTFALVDQGQTFTQDQTFGHDRLKVQNTNADGVATLRYGTAEANRTYTFSGASGTVWTNGNLPITNAGPGSNTPTTRLIITLNGVQYRFDVQQL